MAQTNGPLRVRERVVMDVDQGMMLVNQGAQWVEQQSREE